MEKNSIAHNYNFSRIKEDSDDVDCFHKEWRSIYNFYCIYCITNEMQYI